jgi:carboxypeptidase PM20D1
VVIQITGTQGAFATAQLFKSRDQRFDVILDEGGIILSEGIAPFTHTPVAIIGTSEKVCNHWDQ